MPDSRFDVIHVGPCELEIPARSGGAVERRVWEIAQEQTRKGARVKLFSIGKENSEEVIDGVHISRIKLETTSKSKMLGFLARCSERIEHPDAVIHCHNIPEASWILRRHQNAKVLTFDFPRFRRGRKTPLFFFYRMCLKKFDLVMPVSDFCKTVSARYWLLPKGMFRVSYNGVNLDQFKPDEEARRDFRERHGMTADSMVMVYTGRVNEQKGSDLLIDAYKILRPRYPNLRLVVAGPPGQFGRTGATDLTRGITDACGDYLGAVSDKELVAVFNSADIFVLPTRHDEMFGMVAAEALACGAPVVASDNGGLPEVVSTKAGALFKAGSLESFVTVMADLLEDQVRLRTYKEYARASVVRFSWPAICADLEAAYDIAIKNKQGVRVTREKRVMPEVNGD